MKKSILIGMLLFFSIIVSSPAKETDQEASTQNTALIIQRLNGQVTLDGLSNEAAWKSISPLPMVMQVPNFGNLPSEKTEVLIGFDDDFLYIAGRLFDSEPEKIQSPSKKRDYLEANTEWFGIILDTFNDKENGLGFFTTPSGLRFDAAVFNDAEPRAPGDMPFNISWNTFWDVRTARNGRGWFAEMQIPFSSLRFQDKEKQVVMGLIIWRYIPRKNEVIIFPAIYPKWGFFSGWKSSQAQEILFEGIQSRKPLYMTPYGLSGYGQSNELNDEETAYLHTNKPALEAGLDIKYGLTSNLTLDLTLNTDFAQVEADDVQVNLTRFSLYFPEKRLFFQERSSTFDFSFGSTTKLFYSRAIGIYEGEAVRIYGGARLVGRIGSWDLGFLDMQTASVQDLPSENFGVLRMRRQIFNPYSYIGGIVTTRIGTDGSYNVVYGLDGIYRLSKDDYLLLNWAQCFENGRTNNPVSLDPSRFRLGWERRTIEGVGLVLNLARRGLDYEPGMGFELLEDYAVIGGRASFGWLPSEKSSLQSHSIFSEGYYFLRNEDNSLQSFELGPGWTFSSRSGYNGEFSLKINRESLLESLDFFEEVEVPPGEYSFWGFKGTLQTPAGRLFYTMLNVEAGNFYDGWRLSLTSRPTWVISPDISLSGLYQFNRVEFIDRQQEITAHIARIRLEATLSTKFSASAFVQYNSAVGAVIANLRFRLNPREGNDLYLVINESFNTDRMRETPHLPYYNDRAVMVKYSYTFNS